MPITVTCECGKQLRVKDEMAGKRGRCPGCNAIFSIPAAGGSARASAPAAAPAARPVARPVARPKPVSSRRSTIEVGAGPCPECGAPLAKAAVLCVRCGYNTKSGEKLETAVGAAARTAKTRTPLPKRSKGKGDDDGTGTSRAVRDWGKLYWVLVPGGAIGGLIGGSTVGLVTFSTAAFDSSWEMMKIAWLFFGGAILGAFLVRTAARVLPK